MNTLTFENETCSRCGGTGHYSFNQIDGSMCYGCRGRGVKLTKRGQTANAYLISLMQKPVTDFKVGEYFADGCKVHKITKVGHDPLNKGLYRLESASLSYGVFTDKLVRQVFSKEETNEFKKIALEYQSKLTKTGKLMKKHQ